MPHNATSVRILLVDDHPANLLALEAALDSLGVDMVRAISGMQALSALEQQDFAAVLLDIRMPGMDGIEATSDIKSDPDLAHIPIVAITADSSNDIIARARRAGCAGIMTKPVLPDEVARTITSVLATVRSSDS